MRWVITREPEDSRLLASELGLVVIPCIERVEKPWPEWPQGALVFVTSPSIARRLLREWRTRPRHATSALVAALEPTSATVLREGGLRPDIVAHGGAAELAREVASRVHVTSTLYPTSDVGLEQPEQAEAVRILEPLGPVHRYAVYETRSPDGLSEALARLRGAGFVFYSPSAVMNFARAGGVPGAAVCVGASTARAYAEAGLEPQPLVASVDTIKKTLIEVMHP